jgi:hypothetical protein
VLLLNASPIRWIHTEGGEKDEKEKKKEEEA